MGECAAGRGFIDKSAAEPPDIYPRRSIVQSIISQATTARNISRIPHLDNRKKAGDHQQHTHTHKIEQTTRALCEERER